MSDDQARLLERARQGDESAFAEIYERCQPSIYNYVFYRTGNHTLAEDLTSEVFVRLVGKIRTFSDHGRPILAWLYTIARNLLIDHHRRSGRQAWLPLDEGMAASETAHPSHVAERRLAASGVAAALERLTEPQRQVILLKFMDGCTNAEVAAILGKDEGAVKSLQHRALAALRRELGEEYCYEG